MWQLLPSTALLLVVSASTQVADLSKSVVVSDPPGNRVLTWDRVTFKCQGANPSGDHSTQWLHNGTLISSQTSYVIEAASIENSGEYRCQKGLSELSDPVQLEVHTARSEHSGSYFCRGLMRRRNVSSEAVDIIIQGPPVPSTSTLLPFWPHIPLAVVIALLFAVDTGLYFALQRDLHNSKQAWKNSKVFWKQGP
ncbi:low affinity immunoglobulin gamma Fc region receptor III-like isoform X4 [Meles meles]|uniref:low affinity immunoglobulin gamma Fc region receptor III-like isoform X4 n=1 Tax=Meles meles TaxID=9662 RepID=UPI001E69AC65|nr:low affinity immunoglobulin gamma Fc region receptor III-like isoform X4 [Meles meles]